jgi:hypothetical protein
MGQAVTDDERLARATSAVMGIPVDRARAAVLELRAARRRQGAIEAGLAKFQRLHAVRETHHGEAAEAAGLQVLARLVRSEDGGSGSDALGTKECQRCGKDLPTTEFAIRKLSRDGLSNWHRGCMRDYREERKGRPAGSARPRLTGAQREKVRAMIAQGVPTVQVTTATGVSTGSVSRIRQGKV